MAFVRVASKQKKGPDGNWLCKVCEGPLPGRRTSYCSNECWHRNSPNIMRRKVWRRDRGICALCGVDCSRGRQNSHGTYLDWEMDHVIPVVEGGGLCGLDGYRTLCRDCHKSETVRLHKRLSERRRAEKAQKETGRLFA